MPTKHEVLNAAAILCGEPPLQDVDEESEAGRVLRDRYNPAVAACFEAQGWNFAEARAALARLSETPAWGYDYYYQTPGDMVRILAISETGEEDSTTIKWRLEQGKIATDATSLYVRYTSSANIPLPGMWTQSFADWVAAEVAVRSCPKLNPKNINICADAAKVARRMARTVDGSQNAAVPLRRSSWARAPMSRNGGEQGR